MIFSQFREVEVSTPFGSPSGPLVEGQVSGVDVCMLARHGLGHTILPGDINYRANIWALKVYVQRKQIFI